MRRRREEWRKLVAEWQRSGLRAAEFAALVGVSKGTMQHWKYVLGREGREQRHTALAKIVEVRPALALTDCRFEVQVAGGRCVRVPPSFDDGALQRLLRVLEAAS